MNTKFKVTIDGVSYWSPIYSGNVVTCDTIAENIVYFTSRGPETEPTSTISCECGAEKTGYNSHSDWCPKHE